jgi:hypothetical protein
MHKQSADSRLRQRVAEDAKRQRDAETCRVERQEDSR